MSRIGFCKNCRQKIRWVKAEPNYKLPFYWYFETSRRPVNLSPDAAGSILILSDGETYRFISEGFKKWIVRVYNEPVFISHYETCTGRRRR